MSKKVNVVILSAVILSLLCLSVYAQVGVSGRSSSQRQRQAQPSTTATAAVADDANSFIDPRDDRAYRTVRIGEQTWMAENLNFRTDSSWCYADEAYNCREYGRLYAWNAAMTACPAGWRLPTREDWNNLISVAGDRDTAGIKFKSKSGWDTCYDGGEFTNCDGNGTDEFGFSALPGGTRPSDGDFWAVGATGFWWSATEAEYQPGFCIFYSTTSGYTWFAGIAVAPKAHAMSVRCVQ